MYIDDKCKRYNLYFVFSNSKNIKLVDNQKKINVHNETIISVRIIGYNV